MQRLIRNLYANGFLFKLRDSGQRVRYGEHASTVGRLFPTLHKHRL